MPTFVQVPLITRVPRRCSIEQHRARGVDSVPDHLEEVMPRFETLGDTEVFQAMADIEVSGESQRGTGIDRYERNPAVDRIGNIPDPGSWARRVEINQRFEVAISKDGVVRGIIIVADDLMLTGVREDKLPLCRRGSGEGEGRVVVSPQLRSIVGRTKGQQGGHLLVRRTQRCPRCRTRSPAPGHRTQ